MDVHFLLASRFCYIDLCFCFPATRKSFCFDYYSFLIQFHSSTLAWKIPWTEEPGRLQSMGSPRVGRDWATSLSLFTFMHWRRKWQPTPLFLPGESQGRGQGGLASCSLWSHKGSDMTRQLNNSFIQVVEVSFFCFVKNALEFWKRLQWICKQLWMY